ncbi:MAG: FAD-dependent oxidoreductase [Gammaproteobacteria bacterium]|nr:FAD-dependent oxidoreductase [Gammaproteobacteria bacterium]
MSIDLSDMGIKAYYDVVVIGAGPAGMSVAISLAEYDLSVAVFDECPQPGGQIYRNIGTTPSKLVRLLGRDYSAGKKIVSTFTNAVDRGDIEYHSQSKVWYINGGNQLGVLKSGSSYQLHAAKVVIATGCQERPMPIPGWTLPGVMGAGAAQIMLKSASMSPKSTVLAGSGPLLWLLAYQYCRAGVKVEAMIDTTASSAWWLKALYLARALVAGEYLFKGLYMMIYVRLSGVRIYRSSRDLKAFGENKFESISFQSEGEEHHIQADTLLLHQGVILGLHIVEAAGCRIQWDKGNQCWVPAVDQWGKSSQNQISIVGDVSGIGGAKSARLSGKIVGLRLARELRKISSVELGRLSLPSRLSRWRHKMVRPFLNLNFRVTESYLNPADDVIVCRCEEVTAGTIRQVTRQGCMGPNQAKSFTRCGMGPCQGRMCSNTVEQIMAHELDRSVANVGRYRARPPVRPITLGELATTDAINID